MKVNTDRSFASAQDDMASTDRSFASAQDDMATAE